MSMNTYMDRQCVYCRSPIRIEANAMRRARPNAPVTIDCPACRRPNLLEISPDGRRVTLVVQDLQILENAYTRAAKAH